MQFRKVWYRVIQKIKIAKANYYPNEIYQLNLPTADRGTLKIKALCGPLKNSSPPRTLHLSANSADSEAEGIIGHFTIICQTFPPLSPIVQLVDAFKKHLLTYPLKFIMELLPN